MDCLVSLDDGWLRLFIVLQTALVVIAVAVQLALNHRSAIVLGVLSVAGGIAVGMFIMPHFTVGQVEAWYAGALIIVSVVAGLVVTFSSADELN